VHTVEQLLAQLNADPRRGSGAQALLKHVALDDEAQGLLQSAGLTAASVPAPAQWVRLRRTANVATGGMPVSVLAQVHPDNRLLAVRAAKTLRLDLAGVDLLMPDIRRSWRDGGAGICEVNSQPSLGQITSAPVYAQILHRLVPGDGRIPILLVLGAPADNRCVADIEAALRQRGVCVGCHDAAGVRVNGVQWLEAGATPYAAGRLLVLDRSVQVLVLSVNDASLLQTGLPFDRFDFLLRAGPPDVTLDPVLRMILPACSGRVVSLADAGMTPAALTDWGVTALTDRLYLDETKHAQTD
jgi:cyanophycin synthetase